ncbi:MAG: zinc ABC transporter substrate-binding protein [Treponema sp.]|nr:zinc ABC transporter substrate-binding protein [Treponema sp.]
MISCFPNCRNSNRRTAHESKKPVLALSILPQKYFASRIGGSLIETIVLAGEGQNPHNYEISPRQMQELAKADAWILSGSEFEIMVRPKIENIFSNLKIVNGVEGLSFRLLESGHDHNDEHSGLEIDRHAWLGLEGAKLMAMHIAACLCVLDEANAQFYRENCDKLLCEIEAEFEKLKKDLEPLMGQTVFVYHPSFGYFFDEFGIIQEAVESGGKEPSLRQLGLLIEKARLEKARVIFVQAQFPATAAGTVAAAIDAEIVSLDPLAEDWMANIRIMGEALKRAAGTTGE